MKIKEIRKQFLELLNNGLKVYIDTLPIVRNDPQFPNIKINTIDSTNFELKDEDIDVLFGGEELVIKSIKMTGTYWATDKDMNVSKQMSMTLNLQKLLLQIENDKLVIKDCSCYATINNF
jgi:hypothetical protein